MKKLLLIALIIVGFVFGLAAGAEDINNYKFNNDYILQKVQTLIMQNLGNILNPEKFKIKMQLVNYYNIVIDDSIDYNEKFKEKVRNKFPEEFQYLGYYSSSDTLNKGKTEYRAVKYLFDIYVDSSITVNMNMKYMISEYIAGAGFTRFWECTDCVTLHSVDINKIDSKPPIKREDIYDDSWAVIIGIDKYKYSDQLNYAVKDAEAVKEMLIDKFDYSEGNIRYLTDEKATLSEIKLALDDISTTAGENDRVLVFYSGHGETIKGVDGTEKGYIIPYEGRQNKAYATGLAMDEILTTSMMSPSKHMLFLMDACYSGLMTESVKGLEKSQDKGYLSKVANEKARQIITAGGRDEQVLERDEWQHSAFTKNLLAGLETWEADFNDDGYVTADELSSYLRETVTEDSDYQQTPQDGRFKNSGGGEFVFFGTGNKIWQDETMLDNEEIKPSIPPLYWDNHPLGFNISALTGGMNVKSIGKMTLLSSYLGASYTFNDFVFDFGYEHSKNITSNFAFTSNAIFIEYVDAIAIVHSIIPSGNYLYSSLGFNIENITYIDDITNYKSEDVGVIPKVGLVWGWHWFEKGGMRWDGVINANLGYAINDLTNAAGEKYYNGLIIELGLAMTY